MQQPENQPAQVTRAETPQPTGSNRSTIHCYDLPPDLVKARSADWGGLRLFMSPPISPFALLAITAAIPKAFPSTTCFRRFFLLPTSA